MTAGARDRRIQLRHRVLPASDANGQRKPTYTTYATVWARKEEISGREYFAAQTKQAELITRFTILYRADVLATDRLTCEGRDYEVTQPPSEIKRRKELLIFSRVVVP